MAAPTIDELVEKAANYAMELERKRCAAIIQAARFGEVDQDFRAIIHMIEMGDSVEDLVKRAKVGSEP